MAYFRHLPGYIFCILYWPNSSSMTTDWFWKTFLTSASRRCFLGHTKWSRVSMEQLAKWQLSRMYRRTSIWLDSHSYQSLRISLFPQHFWTLNDVLPIWLITMHKIDKCAHISGNMKYFWIGTLIKIETLWIALQVSIKKWSYMYLWWEIVRKFY